MRNCVVAGQQGIFIPKEEFENGLWLDKEAKIRFQKAVKEQNELIKQLIGDDALCPI